LGKNLKTRKTTLFDDEGNIFMDEADDGYSTERKQRIIELNDPESFDYASLTVSYYKIYFIFFSLETSNYVKKRRSSSYSRLWFWTKFKVISY